MKIRWTRNSVRLRITPQELQALHNGAAVTETFVIPGSGSWSAEIRPRSQSSTVALKDGALCFFLADAELQTLSDSQAEGVYLHWPGQPELRYFIEKDFPCAHPKASEALEPATETFKPVAGFEERKMRVTPD